LFATVGRILKGEASLVDLIRDEEMRAALDEATAILSLLERHADVVMDEVGAGVIPSVRRLRRKFEARRDAGQGGFLSNLLGMDLKLAQYRDGAKFVRAVRREVGRKGFSRVTDEPANLPSPAEIHEPELCSIASMVDHTPPRRRPTLDPASAAVRRAVRDCLAAAPESPAGAAAGANAAGGAPDSALPGL